MTKSNIPNYLSTIKMLNLNMNYGNIAKVLLCLAILFTLSSAVLPSSVLAQEQTTQRINTISLDTNGDAQWSVEIREPLQTETDVSNFEAYVEQVNNTNNNQTTEQFRNEFETVVQGADDTYQRDMSLEQISVDAEVSNTATGTFGVTTIEFTWAGYTEVAENGTIQMGQILSDGYTISESERLTIVPPEGYAPDKTPAGSEVTDDNEIEWTGPYAFDDLNFSLSEMTSDESDRSLSPILIGSVFLVLIVLALIGGYLYRGEEEDDSDEDKWSSGDLETEEEKVVSLLEENDGRVKQKLVGKEFDWSDTKVSRVTGKLEDENVITKLTVGRENVLDLNEGERSEES